LQLPRRDQAGFISPCSDLNWKITEICGNIDE
jgi:hypothetical protein